ncbi:hypothetical protein EYF80_017784 [Liparis tanakae]|uniref:Uncharacterized protein n=1 Tax=Liparis tanakae TaxID=230148 RepID=A0A4Z2I1Q4_9TELE|nr:hypothetical protein EYF80_017784 [Liparis tanakae]
MAAQLSEDPSPCWPPSAPPGTRTRAEPTGPPSETGSTFQKQNKKLDLQAFQSGLKVFFLNAIRLHPFEKAVSPSVGKEGGCCDRLSALGLGGKNNNNNSAGAQKNNTHKTKRTMEDTRLDSGVIEQRLFESIKN